MIDYLTFIEELELINKILTDKEHQIGENPDEVASIFARVKIRTLKELLKIDLDGIIIATNTSSHFQIAKKCLLANHNIFVEKPVTNSFKKLKELRKIAKIKNKIMLTILIKLLRNTSLSF